MSLSSDFAYEFNKEQSFSESLSEDFNFIIENYNKAIFLYRLMKKQNDKTLEDRANAHEELKQLRKKKESLKGKTLTKQEKMELEEKESFLLKERKKSDPIYFRKEELEVDKLTSLITKYQKVFEKIEKADSKGRSHISKGVGKGASLFLWPLEYCLELTSKTSDSSKIKQYLDDMYNLIDKIPSSIKNFIEQDVDLEDHIPEQKSNHSSLKDGEFQIEISL